MAKLILAIALVASSASPPAAGIGPAGLEPSSSADRLLSRPPASPPTPPVATRSEPPFPEDAGTLRPSSWSPPAPSSMGDSAAALLSRSAIGTRPAPAEKPRTARTLRGTASWYPAAGRIGAAGPRLRHFLGRHWRGSSVVVCRQFACFRVLISDWCACPNGRIVDLSDDAFRLFADQTVGLIRVTISRTPSAPATDR